MSKKTRWFLPTNTENLEIFLSSGLMFDAKGFGKDKYMKDGMDGEPTGYIPFFSEGNLESAIKKSYEDDENLTCCIIELDPSKLLNTIAVYSKDPSQLYENGKFSYVRTDVSSITGDIQYNQIQIPSPLPLQCIKNIIFKDKDVKDTNVKYLEGEFGSFPSKFFIESSKLFEVDAQTEGFPTLSDSDLKFTPLPENDINYDKVFSLGGMLALMFYQTKNGTGSVGYFKDVCNLNVLAEQDHKELELINNYFYSLNNNEEYEQLCFELLNLLSKGSVSEIKYEILNYLESAVHFNELKGFVEQAAKILRSIEERTIKKSPEEYFTTLMDKYEGTKDSKKIFMLLVMYFFRDKTETMLKFYHEGFKEIDYILFAMFFGKGCRYIGLPKEVKKIKGLSFYISNRMAEYHHLSDSSEPFFKKVSAPKYVIGGLIKKTSDGNQDKFVKWFSEYLNLDSKKFLSWECKGKEFSCGSNIILKFTEEPKITTSANDTDIGQFYSNFEDEVKTKVESRSGFIGLIMEAFEKFKFWEIKTKNFSCSSKSISTLQYKEQPKLVSLVNMSELEQQVIKATIGNDKVLFDYNEVYEKSAIK